MPKLLFIGGQMGMRRVQANEAELRQMIKEERKKQACFRLQLTVSTQPLVVVG
jgi:hypothetical protein